MPKTVKLTQPWPYSLDGNHVIHGQPGDVLTLPDDLAAAAIARGAQETKVALPPPETKAAPVDDDTEDDEPSTEPGNDGATVPPAVVPPKRKRNR
jgi:hypothetical protein